MELNNADLIPVLTLSKAGLLEDLISAVLGHLVSDNIHSAAPEGGRTIGGKSLSDDLDCLVLKTTSTNEVF
jgi:hypothetical protein